MRVEDFEAIALPHLRDVLRTASRLLRNRTEAEDIVQETYLRAWKSIDRFTPGTNIRAWIYTILFHVISNQRRKWLQFDYKLTTIEEAHLEKTLLYEAPVTQQLTDEDLLTALDKLPSGFKAVLLLAVVEEFAYKEVAEILQIPIGTVMSRLYRGRKLLASELRNQSLSSL